MSTANKQLDILRAEGAQILSIEPIKRHHRVTFTFDGTTTTTHVTLLSRSSSDPGYRWLRNFRSQIRRLKPKGP